jgi:hypothetical protein
LENNLFTRDNEGTLVPVDQGHPAPVIYGNARLHNEHGWVCCDTDGKYIKDAAGNYVLADRETGKPKSELPPICSECKRPLPVRKR